MPFFCETQKIIFWKNILLLIHEIHELIGSKIVLHLFVYQNFIIFSFTEVSLEQEQKKGVWNNMKDFSFLCEEKLLKINK